VKLPAIWSRRIVAAASTTGLIVGVLAATGSATASAAPGGAKNPHGKTAAEVLGSHDGALLATAQAKQAPRVTLLVAADKGQSKAVSDRLTKLGATISRRVDAVGYVRASVPTGKVLDAAVLPGITAVDLDETIKLPDVRPQSGPGPKATPQATVTGPGADTPAANAFMPTSETGAVRFKQQHPTWDGRGVTIGELDTGVDLDNPALQTTSTGEKKIVDWVTETDPIFDGDGTWRAMLTAVSGPTFTIGTDTYTAPAGSFMFNRFSESTAGGELGGDVNRDGDTADRFGILYNPATHDIRVDSDGDKDFTNNPVMRPYKEKGDVGHFGVDNPATAVRDQIPFVVEFRTGVDTTPAGLPGTADFVNIGIVAAQHGTHVAGILGANNMLGNANLDGAAPGAKIVSARACRFVGGCTAAALTDGMTDLVVNRHVDVVNMSIGGLPALNDGNNARATLYNRLISDFGVQLFISMGNDGPGVNTAGDPGVATDVVAAAAAVSQATWLANYGSVTRTPNQLFDFSSRGPREDGGFKPNIAAPGSAISTTPLWQAGGPVAEAGYALPPGLSMLNGTSMASPEAAGVAALLLSAAKANDLGITPAALRAAIYTSAKPIAGVPAYAQGNGEIDAVGAWALLGTDFAQPRGYTADAPVCSPLSDLLATPGHGTGIYNRCAASAGGHAANQAKNYAVTLTRTSGAARAIRHNLSWVGNDGTFSGPSSVSLALNRPVTITVKAKPAAGVHSALLRVDDPATPILDFETMNVVVASTTPVTPAFNATNASSVDRNLFKSYFVTVPAGAGALQVNLTGIGTGTQVRWIAINPSGVEVDSTASTACYTNFSDRAACNPNSRAYLTPQPGVWELEVEARRTSPALSNPFQLTAAIQGVTVNPAATTLASVRAGVGTPLSWQVHNSFGPVAVHAANVPLGSTFAAKPSIATGDQQTFTVAVPAGATTLDVQIGNPSDQAADLDLTVLLNGVQVGQSADADAEERVTLTNPAAGTYTVVVDGFDVPAGTTTYDYHDTFFSPALGSVTASQTPVSLANSGTVTLTGTVTATSVPPAGRTLSGELDVTTSEGAVIGRGVVTIAAVTAG
jgi:subtilisin family serine protease